MAELHDAGGVPPGWRFTLPEGDVPAGRKAFVDLGCHSCHAVKGEAFSPAGDDAHVGPELTAMGSHHPAGYFAESIVNPDAIVVDGPGYDDDEGRSRMPAYPDLTVLQLADLVAYLRSLTDSSGPFREDPPATIMSPRPPAPASEARLFFVQAYDVKDGQLEAFEQWFASDGLPALRGADGFVSAETHVLNNRPGPALVTVIAFRDENAFGRFLASDGGTVMKQKFDSFIGPHDHTMFRTSPLYRVDSLSGN